jgi:hypothetical protein
MNVGKRIRSKRIALRLHIEQMKVTANSLKNRSKRHGHDAMAYQTATAAHQNLQDKISKAESELAFLEKTWKVL